MMTSKVLLFVFQLFPENTSTPTSISFDCVTWTCMSLLLLLAVDQTQGRFLKWEKWQKQWLTQRRLIWINFFFLVVALCCTRCKPTTEVSMDCTVPGERLCYCTSMGLPEVQCRPETLNVTVMDQFYKHVLLHFSPHNEFCWFSFLFSFFSF